MIKGIKNNDIDNVATIFGHAYEECEIEVTDSKGIKDIVIANSSIPYGHKIAVKDILKKEQITKYGEEIGIATKNIKKGEHVHVHNIESIRGRGDWNEQGGNF